MASQIEVRNVFRRYSISRLVLITGFSSEYLKKLKTDKVLDIVVERKGGIIELSRTVGIKKLLFEVKKSQLKLKMGMKL